MDFLAAFASLPRPTTPGGYSVTDEASNCRIGKSFEGHPAVLVSLPTRDGIHLQRRLANFAYRPPTAVDVRTATATETRELAIVECVASERQLASYFYRVVGEIMVPEAASGSEARFETAVDAVITLFKSLQRPGARTVQGLWAELAMIAFATDVATATSSWHSSARALHDFSSGRFRLEVKSSTKKLREHDFLLDQLMHEDDGETLIASLLLEEHDGGCSVFDLLAVIKRRLSSREAQNRLETIVADALGSSIDAADEYRYDLDGSRISLALFCATDVPRTPPAPAEVKNVSFTADLSNTPQIPLADARRISAQMASLLPSDV